ncbi:ankyrin [Cadophora sp. DSE1049]|nr:ankyrin [Cadophora sp. DSE1049]
MATLESAIEDQDIALVEELLRSTPGPSQRELDKALAFAVDPELGLPEAVIPLFEKGAHITENVFLEAITREGVELFEIFLKYGWDVNSVEFGQPALRLSIGSETSVKWLLEHGADPNITGGKYPSPLVTAALESLSPVFDILISHGAKLDPQALFLAMSPRGKGGIPVMEYLIDHGIDINAVRPDLGTPLHYAVTLGSKAREKLELLLRRGADRTVKNTSGVTPAELAKQKGYLDLLDILEG